MGITKRQRELKAKRVIARIVGLQVGDKVRVKSDILPRYNGTISTVVRIRSDGYAHLAPPETGEAVAAFIWPVAELQLIIG